MLQVQELHGEMQMLKLVSLCQILSSFPLKLRCITFIWA